MKIWINDYFSFTKREFNGFLALMFILTFLSIFPMLYERFFLKQEGISAAEKAIIEQLNLSEQQSPTRYAASFSSHPDNESEPGKKLFKFDPNKIGLAAWQKLGLSLKQAKSILNYTSKGGKFYQTADLQKMYTISPQKYQELAPYVSIENESKWNDKPVNGAKSFPAKKEVVIELNAADTLALDQLRGIGAAFARRITKYRDRLGGFYKKEQLLEVFGLDSAKYLEIKDQIQIDGSRLKKIHINTATFDELKQHPYLKYKQINAIIEYRKQHGKYAGIDDLKKVLILSAQTIEQISPYLQF